MPFDATQINDARTREVYKGLKEEGKLKTSMVDIVCSVVPSSGIPGHAGNIKTLDFQAIFAPNDGSGFQALNAAAEELTTPTSDRPYQVQKIAKFKEYARGLNPDQLFQKIKESFVPHLSEAVSYDRDAELANVLMGSGTATGNAQDVTVRQLSATANEPWSDPASKPLDDLRSAVDDCLGDMVIIGKTKANQLQDHPDLQSATGMKYITAGQLAGYLEGFLMVDRVIIGKHVYQGGSQVAAADVKYVAADAACVTNSANILYLDWIDAEFETDVNVSTNVEQLHMRRHGSIVTINPIYTIAFQDVA